MDLRATRRALLVSSCTAFFLYSADALLAQGGRLASPRGVAATQLGGTWTTDERGRERYEGGKWIELDYGRPILRQRRGVFGAGEEYGKKVAAGAPVWRAGANQSTRFTTEVDLLFGGKRLPAGTYSVFIDLASPQKWTLIFSNWAAQDRYDPNAKDALWGSYGYTPDKDVLRADMSVASIPMSVDQLTFGFVDVTADSGTLAFWWDTTTATVPFQVAK
jgi:hypothetical protein